MVAAVTEIYSSRELDKRLERWADWARSPSIGTSNGTIGYLKERLDKAADSFEMTDEIAITERAVARTKIEEKAYWRVLARYYLGRLSLAEIALQFHVSDEGLKRLFQSAKARVHDHILDIERNY